MGLIIGIDLDNTIISYACSMKWCVNKFYQNQFLSFQKLHIKNQLQQQYGEKEWMRFQGLLYSRGIQYAKPYPDVLEVIKKLYMEGCKLFIVSHKTQFGHYDKGKIDLRDKAIEWLKRNDFLTTKNTGLSAESVFFCHTRDEKVDKIISLRCDYFIDDLIYIFKHERFPKNCRKIVFDPDQVYIRRLFQAFYCSKWSQILTAIENEKYVIS